MKIRTAQISVSIQHLLTRQKCCCSFCNGITIQRGLYGKTKYLQRPSSPSRFLQNHLFPALIPGISPNVLRDKKQPATR